MLCAVCEQIDFDAANCSPEVGGAAHQPSFPDLVLSASNGCELCNLIHSTILETSNTKPDGVKDPLFCNVWNWYDGLGENYKGSCTIVFYVKESKWSAVLGIAADEDSIPAIMKVVSGRRAQLTANSEHCFKLATQWINNCLNRHSLSCPFDATASLPTRVVDVGLGIDTPQVRVFETKGLQGTWVALSHCWGRLARLVTETSNLHERTQGIALSDLPETFLDAIKVTRKLGYRYLWIDSLCILQDSHQDWIDESGRMQDYYSKAVLTIASDLATGDHEGFLDSPRPESILIKVPFNSEATVTRGSHVYIFKDVKIPGIDADVTPLSVRGWTLQEDVLSPRSLHYTTMELIFECQQSRFVETDLTPQGYNDVDQMRSIKRYFLRPESGFNDPLLLKYPTYEAYYQPIGRWYRLFENYCSRLLTFESDRLAAIAGLAKEIQRQTKFSYKAGLWAEDIHTGLLWAINGRGERAEKYRAPSWSWASLDIRYYWGISINPNFELYMLIGHWSKDSSPENSRRAEVLGCDVETINGDPFGPVMSGQLRLRGYMLPLSGWKGKTETYINIFWSSVRSHQRGITIGGIERAKAADQLICDFDITPEEDEELFELGDDTLSEEEEEEDSDVEWRSDKYPRDVVLFQIQRHVRPGNETVKERAIFISLLLQPTSQESKNSEYRRVGIAEVPDINGLGRDGWENREIVII